MLEIKHLSLTYGEAEKSLHDITFSVADGECVLLAGKSGSGKSSILRAIN
ncbi:MAG: ATP-binding cassette domain-containing protein, partial [Peptoniphilaceae bacterium]